MDYVTTEIRVLENDYTELVEYQPRACAVGRLVKAQLVVKPTKSAGPSRAERGTVALVIETKRRDAAEYTESARTPTFFIDEAKVATVVVPSHPAANAPPVAPGTPGVLRLLDPKELPDLFRVRLIYTGRLRPYVDVGLVGM